MKTPQTTTLFNAISILYVLHILLVGVLAMPAEMGTSVAVRAAGPADDPNSKCPYDAVIGPPLRRSVSDSSPIEETGLEERGEIRKRAENGWCDPITQLCYRRIFDPVRESCYDGPDTCTCLTRCNTGMTAFRVLGSPNFRGSAPPQLEQWWRDPGVNHRPLCLWEPNNGLHGLGCVCY